MPRHLFSVQEQISFHLCHACANKIVLNWVTNTSYWSKLAMQFCFITTQSSLDNVLILKDGSLLIHSHAESSMLRGWTLSQVLSYCCCCCCYYISFCLSYITDLLLCHASRWSRTSLGSSRNLSNNKRTKRYKQKVMWLTGSSLVGQFRRLSSASSGLMWGNSGDWQKFIQHLNASDVYINVLWFHKELMKK